MSNYVDSLAIFSHDLELADVPLQVIDRARLVALDTLGAVLGARDLPEVASLRNWSSCQGSGPAMNALADGAAGVFLELDEGCASSKGHPGIHVVPAAFNSGVAQGSSGPELLTALITGYEVAARLGAATQFRDGIHPHGTWGACGGAVAVGRLIGLSTEQLAAAIRTAAALSVATNYQAVHEGSVVRNLWTGMGNFVAVMAAQLAGGGYSGPVNAPAEVYGGILGHSFDEEKAAAGLGSDWYLGRNYFKEYACCRHTHASVDALRQVVDRCDFPVADIERIDVFTYGRAVAATGHNDSPGSPLAAKFSLPYILAAYLENRSLTPTTFMPPTLHNDAIRLLAKRVQVKEDPVYTDMLPATRGARVEVLMQSGKRLSGEALGSRGDPDKPLSAAEVEMKFRNLATPIVGRDHAEEIVALVQQLEAQPSIKPLARLLA